MIVFLFLERVFVDKGDRILIVGHCGLIGSSLWNRLREYYRLYGFDLVALNDDGFSENVDMIIHCSSYCVIREVIKNPQLMVENIKMTYKVMEKAKEDNAKVVLMSSSRLNSLGNSPYTVGKQFMENISDAYKDCYGIDRVIIRPETIWGYKKEDDRVIPNWIKLSKNNEDIVVYGDQTKELSPLFVEDFTNEIIKIISNFDNFKNKCPITITGKPMKVIDIISIIKDFYRSRSKVVFLDPEMSQPQTCSDREEEDIILDNKLKERLGFNK